MRIILCFAVSALLVFFEASAQQVNTIPDYGFLRQLHFENGKATVTFKAIYTGAMRNGDYYFFRDSLDKHKILDSKKYFTVEHIEGEGEMDAGTCLIFVPDNYSKEFAAAIAEGADWVRFKLGQAIYLTCTVYRDIHRYKDQPFYLIDKVEISRNDMQKPQLLKPLVHLNLRNVLIDDFNGYYTDYGSDDDGINWLVLINKKHQAIIETAKHKRHILDFVKRTATAKGFVEYYKNKSESLEFNINRVIDRSATSSIQLGYLNYFSGSKKTVIRVYGEIEHADHSVKN